MTIQDISVPLRITAEDLQKAVRPIVESALNDIKAEHDRTFSAIGDSVQEKNRSVQASADSMIEKHAALRKRIDDELESLKEKLTKKANSYLIPVATVILLAGIIGLWALVGGVTMALRKEANDAIAETRSLQSQLNEKKKDLEALSVELTQIKGQIEQARSQSPALDQEKRFAAIEASNKRLESRIDALFSKVTVPTIIAAPIAAPSATQPASPSTTH